MTGSDQDTVVAVEHWFVRHGLPYFVDSERAIVERGLNRTRLLAVGASALLLGVAAGVVTGMLADDLSGGLTVGLLVAGLVLMIYAGTTLRFRPIARWAMRRTFRSLGMMFPLVRLPEELDRVDDEIHGSRLVASCQGTPLASVASEVVDGVDHERHVEVTGSQKANLILVLLVSQAVQVLLLSLAVFSFFMVFGTVVMEDKVVVSWIGRRPDALFGGLTYELTQVSVFLAGFSGLYFTVYAVTDSTYREQFFTNIIHELERAIGVRAVYQALRRGLPAER